MLGGGLLVIDRELADGLFSDHLLERADRPAVGVGGKADRAEGLRLLVYVCAVRAAEQGMQALNGANGCEGVRDMLVCNGGKPQRLPAISDESPVFTEKEDLVPDGEKELLEIARMSGKISCGSRLPSSRRVPSRSVAINRIIGFR